MYGLLQVAEISSRPSISDCFTCNARLLDRIARTIRTQMRSIVTDRVALSVGLSICLPRSPAKTAEPIEMLFELWTRVDQRKHVLDGMHIGATW